LGSKDRAAGLAGQRVRVRRRHGRAWLAIGVNFTHCVTPCFEHTNSGPEWVAAGESIQRA
jgi:hypothetical protein